MDVLFFLLIFPMMISSGESDHPKKMEIKQCSVFPGRPKCFASIKEFGGGQRELIDDVAKTVETINTGKSVAISDVKISGVSDATAGRSIGDPTMTLSCTKDTDYNDAEHGTQFWGKNGKKWENQLNAKDLVITTRREKWSCRQGNTIKLYRMVSEHLTKKNIGKVNFPEGTFIHKIPIPRLQHDEQQMYRAVIREIKYTDKSFEKKSYDGYFRDRNNDMAEENKGDFIELKKDGDRVTVSNSVPGSSGRIIYKRKALIIKTNEAFKNKQSRATCYKLAMDHFITDRVFGIFPEWSYSINGQPFTPLENTKFREKFIITKYQIFGCEIESQPKHTFFRVEIEYLFTEDVNEVHVTDTIDKIYKFKLPGSSTETSFGIVETFDFNLENPTDAFRFAGTATIDKSFTLWNEEELNMDKVPVEKSNQGKSSTRSCFGCFGPSKTAP